MKIKLVSDLHLDLFEDNGFSYVESQNPDGEDITLVIAGDMSESHLVSSLLKQFCDKYPHIIYVPGNHDYWHSRFEKLEDELRNLSDKISNLHWLDISICELNGVRFIGGTLWFEHTALSPIYNIGWADFQQISNPIDDFYIKNSRTKWFLEQNLREGDIVVSHHLPSYQSCSKTFLGDPNNIFYGNRIDDLIEDRKPALWLHGHTHDSADYYIGSTRVLCNPRGYPGSINPNFNDQLILDI